MDKRFKKKYTSKLLKYIPGGAHTYSRGADQFSLNAPQILNKGKGAYVYDVNNKKYLDYGMGLRSIILGYSNQDVNKSAYQQIQNGNNLTRPSMIELKAAKTFVNNFKNVDMVKFAKNGSSAVTAAVKLARAYTKKNIVLRCAQHPFFSYDDWFIGSTKIQKGIPKEIIKMTDTFKYNDIDDLKKKIRKHKNNVACIILEPAATECPKIENKIGCCGKYPCNRNYKKQKHFLKEVGYLCKKNKIVFILDEMITGFRWDIKGAQEFFNVKPDLSTFGKAMANGFSVSAVCGIKKIMTLGSIEKKGQERVFLLSTTHGAEMSSLGAFDKTLDILKKKNVIKSIWSYGAKLILEANKISKSLKIEKNFYFEGPACSPIYYCRNKKLDFCMELRTLFIQEMLKNGVLMPWVSISYMHKEKEFKKTIRAIEKSLIIYKKYLNGNKELLMGNSIKPVFRKYN